MASVSSCPRCETPGRPGARGEACPVCGSSTELEGEVRLSANGATSRGRIARDSGGRPLASGSGPSQLAASPGVLETLAGSFGPVPHVLLRDTDDGTEPPLHRPAEGNGTFLDTRYRIDGEIARGGMGAVLKGRDPDLGRDVALKVLREDLRDNADMVRRFVEEAQIGGQLQHPGIVPIYELGTFGDSRPFFAMKLVKGRTLAGMLEDRAKPSDELPKFLAIFESIAQTVAYAHARGVIHRDLKPSNVMVGSFGEVQVMDWGLAKVLPRGGVIDDAHAGKSDRKETVIATARSGSDDSDLSRAGSAMGTPSYMAPEQARGEIDRIDERADVFALGSILCEILTGDPAFLGRGGGEIQRKAALGDLADAMARLDGNGADAELVALAKNCLAREADDRPRSAGVVAERITAYLAGVQNKLRQAELDRVEERARRRLTTVAAAALILLGLTGGGAYVWNQQQKLERIAKTARAVDEALADAARLRGEAQAAPAADAARWAEALSAAKRADGLLAQGEADAPLRGRVAALLAQLDSEQTVAVEKAGRLETDRVLLAELESIRGNRAEHYDRKRTDAEYGAAFRKAGLDLDSTGPADAGKWLKARSAPLELAVHLDDWAHTRRNRAPAVADWKRLVAAARAADPDPWRDALRARVGTGVAATAEFQRLADDEQALDAQTAPSLFLLALQLENGIGDRERAARVLRWAVFRYPADFWARSELGKVHGVGSTELSGLFPMPAESVRHLTAAVAIRPGSALAHDTLGNALRAQGKIEEALAEFREAIRLKPDYFLAHMSLGAALVAGGKNDEAVAEFRTAIRCKPDDAVSHSNLGAALAAGGKSDEAIAEFRDAIRIKHDHAEAHNNLAHAFIGQGKLSEAIAEAREAIRISPNFAEPHNNRGLALLSQGKSAEAVTEFREAIRLKPNYARAHQNLGTALSSQGKHTEAIAAYSVAIRIKPDDAMAHNNLAFGLAMHPDRAKRDIAAALEHARNATSLQPKNRAYVNTLAAVQYRAGLRDEALASCRKSMELGKGGDPYDWFFLAMIEHDRGNADEAARWFDKSMAWLKQQKSPDADLLQIWAEAAKLIGRPSPEPPDQKPVSHPK
jgi:eukaryotic-like serine/threonine-protein kinase